MSASEIGLTLANRRKRRKIRQDQLSEIAGVSVRTVRDIENGVGNPELATLLKLCDVLGMELTITIRK